MVFELVVVWCIVVGAIVWFVRDERRQRADAKLAEAARYYAHAPRYRHQTDFLAAEPVLQPLPRTGGLTPSQREFLEGLASRA